MDENTAEYILELKQIVDYPRCRIYRNFIQNLILEPNIRTKGSSYLFYYVVLCSYANFRTSYRRLDGVCYTIYPGEWICNISELKGWLRTRRKYEVLNILEQLQEQNHITYSVLGRGNIVKFKIRNWKHHNKILDYNAPCQKDTGFFFFPISKVSELISIGKCSEMDILLDLWIHAIYNDERVQGSDVGPVVYFRNETGCPLVGYAELAERWGMSKATVGRTLKHLAKEKFISLLSFPGRHGSTIYLSNYMSTMFQISDLMIDKEEVALSLNIKLSCGKVSEPDNSLIEVPICVPEPSICVSKLHIHTIIKKVAQVLGTSGLSCCKCMKIKYKLYPLSVCKSEINYYHLIVLCGEIELYRFELQVTKSAKLKITGGKNHDK